MNHPHVTDLENEPIHFESGLLYFVGKILSIADHLIHVLMFSLEFNSPVPTPKNITPMNNIVSEIA